MKLGIVLRTTGPTPRLDLDFVLEAERLGAFLQGLRH